MYETPAIFKFESIRCLFVLLTYQVMSITRDYRLNRARIQGKRGLRHLVGQLKKRSAAVSAKSVTRELFETFRGVTIG